MSPTTSSRLNNTPGDQMLAFREGGCVAVRVCARTQRWEPSNTGKPMVSRPIVGQMCMNVCSKK